MRVFLLVIRVNAYDSMDDFFDSFAVFFCDFDDEELVSELLFKVSKAVLTKKENNDDSTHTRANEYDFIDDLFYIYFLLWGKLFYFTFFILEEAARLSLAFYVCYLIIFEVHNVNSSRKEDNFFSN